MWDSCTSTAAPAPGPTEELKITASACGSSGVFRAQVEENCSALKSRSSVDTRACSMVTRWLPASPASKLEEGPSPTRL